MNTRIAWQTVRHRVSIAGIVSNRETQAAIAGAKVEITNLETTNLEITNPASRSANWTMTRADGAFVFMDLPPGSYSIAASLPDAKTRYGVVSSETISVVSSHLPPNSPSLNLMMQLPPTALSGRIINGRQECVKFARVRVQPSGETVFSDEAGIYLLSGLEAGSTTIDVSAKGYQSKTEIALLTPGQKSVNDIQLEDSVP